MCSLAKSSRWNKRYNIIYLHTYLPTHNCTQCFRRGDEDERCLRESDGPFDVMYVCAETVYGTKGTKLPLSIVYKRIRIHTQTHSSAVYISEDIIYTHKSEQTPTYYPAHLTLILPGPRDVVVGMGFFFLL